MQITKDVQHPTCADALLVGVTSLLWNLAFHWGLDHELAHRGVDGFLEKLRLHHGTPFTRHCAFRESVFGGSQKNFTVRLSNAVLRGRPRPRFQSMVLMRVPGFWLVGAPGLPMVAGFAKASGLAMERATGSSSGLFKRCCGTGFIESRFPVREQVQV